MKVFAARQKYNHCLQYFVSTSECPAMPTNTQTQGPVSDNSNKGQEPDEQHQIIMGGLIWVLKSSYLCQDGSSPVKANLWSSNTCMSSLLKIILGVREKVDRKWRKLWFGGLKITKLVHTV